MFLIVSCEGKSVMSKVTRKQTALAALGILVLLVCILLVYIMVWMTEQPTLVQGDLLRPDTVRDVCDKLGLPANEDFCTRVTEQRLDDAQEAIESRFVVGQTNYYDVLHILQSIPSSVNLDAFAPACRISESLTTVAIGNCPPPVSCEMGVICTLVFERKFPTVLAFDFDGTVRTVLIPLSGGT